ncbi:hypothetical protein LQZ19_03370 [Treponema primitia]|uniref:ATP-binding protein n=1 Tax=Treponema primitia TaxID=88058 RepID=UPI00397EDC4B
MKLMTRLLLIHWHYFTHTSIGFEKINFLTGKNASGKSTIIDALQVILLADTSGNSFNKAASGKSNRTLKGYLLGELGDDEGSGFKYLRNGRFTSFIALEFFDDEKDAYFTAGCCFDVYSENDFTRMFFRFNDRIPDNEFVADRKPMEIALLRSWIRDKYNANNSFTTDTNQSFRTDLYGKLGGLQSRFGPLLKKAVSFDPNVDIQKFISEFVCDAQQPVDISGLQDNIQSYTRLENEEALLRERMEELGKINESYDAFDTHRRNEMLYGYLVDKARLDIKDAAIQNQEKIAGNLSEEIRELIELIEEENARFEKLQNEKYDLHAKLLNNESARIMEHLESQIREKEDEAKSIQVEFGTISKRFAEIVFSWVSGTRGVDNAPVPVEPLLASLIQNLKNEVEKFGALLGDIDVSSPEAVTLLGEDEFCSRVLMADGIRSHSSALLIRLREEQDRIRRKQGDLRLEQESLEKGIYRFPQDVLDLREAIASRIRGKAGKSAEVLIVAEAAEIQNKRWRNVIEGYLNTQKFYLIVPPEHFNTALHVYDTIKRERNIYGAGIVDIEKIEKLNPRPDPGSLAEEISTSNNYVRLFLDYTLGRVMKCDKVGDLRRFNTSVTDEGMLYRNFVARAMNPGLWAKPAIGQDAIRQRLDDVKQELVLLTEGMAIIGGVQNQFQPLSVLAIPGESEPGRLVKAAEMVRFIPKLEEEIEVLRKNLASVDKSAIEALRERIETLDTMLKSLREQMDQHKRDQATDEEKLRAIMADSIPKLKGEYTEMEGLLSEKFPEQWLSETGIPRYQKELAERGDPLAIEQAFPRELSRSSNAKESFWEELRESRRRYNDKHKMGYDTTAIDNGVYESAWFELSENKLPVYHVQIEDARKKAYEQFREDFLSKLQSNINDAKQQIDGLNDALSKSFFGDDTYRFRIIPQPDYKRYYDMIIDPMLVEGGYTLFSEQFNTKYKDEIGELFSLITNVGDRRGAEGREDYEKRVQTFTDFRTYLSFDLEVINGEGESQRLSKTMGKKSGGETQTPFYIAVLASFTQLYRTGRDKKANTARIIIFDEAFSKMDSERIISSIKLLRQFNFQVILSAPPDKIGDIAILVDRNLCVLREGKLAAVRGFDPRKIEELKALEKIGAD